MGSIIVIAVGYVLLVFVVALGVRLGMRWSRADERKERAARESLGVDRAQRPEPPNLT
ncbi:hypothetical protein GCM10009700_20340 [Brevibacterium sanguinis]|jgi:hypothetical protein|uniref:hypothetical protein n=1 Tax=Brevibacterium sanguinis TaxID=232444 RepID=UPI0031DF942F